MALANIKRDQGNLIRRIIEPQRLCLVWQEPDKRAARTRYVVASVSHAEGGEPCLTYLVNTPDFKSAVERGFEYYPAFPRDSAVHCTGVMSALMRRLPPRNRADFSKYLLQHRIDPTATISDFALLGYTGARLPSDGFSIIHPFDGAPTPAELVIEVAGYRFHKTIKVKEGELLTARKEPENEQDPRAIALYLSNSRIGYIPRPLIPAFEVWIEHSNVQIVADRFNGTISEPRIYAFVTVGPQSPTRITSTSIEFRANF